MEKVYNRIIWENDTTPALNDTNLNAMSKGLDDLDDRVIDLAGDMVQAVADCSTAATTATTAATTATNKAGEASTSAQSASTSAQSASTNALKSEGYALGQQSGSDVSSSSPYYHNNSKYYSEQAAASAAAAGSSSSGSAADALKAEGYAVGKQNGSDVGSGSPYYHNNSKYYSDQAAGSASSASSSAASAAAWSANPPYIGANGNWYVYDTATSAYKDSGIDASITIKAGTTTTLSAGSLATVENSGTQTDAIFDFGIPKGDKGDTGSTPTISMSATVNSSTGTPGVQVSQTGTAEAPLFTLAFTNLKGEKGDTGNTGATGADGASAYDQAVDGGYSGTEAQFNADLANFATYASSASSSASSASSDALKSEGYAIGEQNGTPVTSGSTYYENNAKYYSDLAAQYASSFDGLVFKGSIAFNAIPTTGMTNGDMYDINETFTTDSRFEEGSGIACAAGTDIVWVADDNKWNILTPAGVYSFNGRSGAVSPASGDYDAADITYNTNSTVSAALGNKLNKPTIKSQTLAANATSVTFTGLPTSGDYMIDFFIEGGANYTAIDTSTAGQVTLTYDATSSARSAKCRIEEVS